MVNIKNNNLSLREIADSGQCFRMEELEDGRFRVIARDKIIYLQQEMDRIDFDCEKDEFENIWKEYFDLDTDYGKLLETAKLDKDNYLEEAMEFGSGIRILHQDLWEMIITFIISQQNNIKRIKKLIEIISEKYGKKCTDKYGNKYYSFPTPEELNKVSIEELNGCSLGYRSKYIFKTSEMIVSKEVDLDEIKKMNYKDAREELLKLVGIGKKVADCICLFALHHLEAFPIDTHIKQVFAAHYPDGFPFAKYSGYEGVIQQYIFYYDLHGND
ncbi:MAG: 8-oxoguanine DNA glycosylase [Lachnospiraceae bacterium]|nr:8-oxoguanine DNA glycosylase [Lachnospiraceae bacterium]